MRWSARPASQSPAQLPLAIQAKLAAAAEAQAAAAAKVLAGAEPEARAEEQAQAEVPTADPAAEAEARRLRGEAEDAMLRRRLGLTSRKR